MKLDRTNYLRVFSALCAALLSAQLALAQTTTYPTVTDARLEHPDAGDWLMYRRTFDGSGFSPLRQINTSNVEKLSLAWSLSTDLVEAHETTPIVNQGRMFITTPGNNVIALDAKTGTQLWRYVKKYPDGLFQLHPTNRGVALYGNRVYMATTDCLLVALDAAVRDTTLLIAPNALPDFLDFNDFTARAERRLARAGFDGVLQLASFHPQFQFAGTEADDIGNATNRAPHPTLHLLREDSVSRAVEAFPEAEAIFERNIDTLEALGAQGWAELDVGPGSAKP